MLPSSTSRPGVSQGHRGIRHIVARAPRSFEDLCVCRPHPGEDIDGGHTVDAAGVGDLNGVLFARLGGPGEQERSFVTFTVAGAFWQVSEPPGVQLVGPDSERDVALQGRRHERVIAGRGPGRSG